MARAQAAQRAHMVAHARAPGGIGLSAGDAALGLVDGVLQAIPVDGVEELLRIAERQIAFIAEFLAVRARRLQGEESIVMAAQGWHSRPRFV